MIKTFLNRYLNQEFFLPFVLMLPDQIKKTVTGLSEVENMHHMHVWQLNDNEVYLEAHVDFGQDLKLSQVCSVMKNIQQLLEETFNISHTTLQPEFGVSDPKHLVVDDH